MTPLVALSDGVIFAIGSVVFVVVFTGAFGLGMARFAELGRREPNVVDEPPREDPPSS